ncbi:hypothetical protein [Paenibacillus dendritiformis]|uniref:hypothetical protein n=1 Tax=Paenibacillus dendritiformis TaxID=130049 RepID=UPI00111069FB|nr:hypothetical protein [Paenibacillus dendritiformis]CAH8772057.1 hypothetical protein H7S4_004794 [Paenibacillus dendritiformis]
MTDNRMFPSKGLSQRETALFGVSANGCDWHAGKRKGEEARAKRISGEESDFTVKNIFNEYLKDYLQNIFYH